MTKTWWEIDAVGFRYGTERIWEDTLYLMAETRESAKHKIREFCTSTVCGLSVEVIVDLRTLKHITKKIRNKEYVTDDIIFGANCS